MSTAPLVSVVVPTLDEEVNLGLLLGDLAGMELPCETIVVDGGSRDATCDVAVRGGASVVAGARGRGMQLATGAAAARADVLWFVHADVRLPRQTLRAVEERIRAGLREACSLRLAIADPSPLFRLIEAGALLRGVVLGLPYGDQTLLVRKADYVKAGGFSPVPIMEDVLLVRALGRVRTLWPPVVVSARRWRQDGALRRTLMNIGLLAAFAAGASPATLARRYRRDRSR